MIRKKAKKSTWIYLVQLYTPDLINGYWEYQTSSLKAAAREYFACKAKNYTQAYIRILKTSVLKETVPEVVQILRKMAKTSP